MNRNNENSGLEQEDAADLNGESQPNEQLAEQTNGEPQVSEQPAQADEPQVNEQPQTSEPQPRRLNDAPAQTEATSSVAKSGNFADKLKSFGKAAWAYIKHAKIELIVLAAALILDQLTKIIVNATMNLNQSVCLIPDFLYMTYVHNYKAAFGSAFGLEKILTDKGVTIAFLIITFIAMCVFAYIMYRCRRRHILMRVSLALILGGALGNFIDRLCLGYVRDFVEIVFFGCEFDCLGSTVSSFAIFNIADAALTVGVIVFLIYFIVLYKEPKKKETAPASGSAWSDDGGTAEPQPAAPDGQPQTGEQPPEPQSDAEQPEQPQPEQPQNGAQTAEPLQSDGQTSPQTQSDGTEEDGR